MAHGSKNKRSYQHNRANYPLAADSELEQVRRSVNLYSAATKWGGTVEEWAHHVGKSERTVRRWLKDPSTMDAESVSKTCKLFNVSLHYLRNGAIVFDGLSKASPLWRPTSAEKGRYDADSMAKAYSRLDESEQRAVTAIVERMLIAHRLTAQLAGKDVLLKRVLTEEISEEELDSIYYGEMLAEEIAEEQALDYEQYQALDDARDELERVKAAFSRAQRSSKQQGDAAQGADNT